MIIANNIMGINTLNNLKKNESKVSKSLEKLATGVRINKGQDDSSGLAISEKMRAQIRGLNQAEKNIQQGITLIHTAEGGIEEITNCLQRVRELAIQAANDTLNTVDRSYVQKEIQQLLQGIDSIVENTEFNTMKLLNGSRPHFRNKVETTKISEFDYENVLTNVAVDSNGSFMFKTNKGYPTTEADNDTILVYGNGSSSRPAVKIGNNTYELKQQAITPTVNEGGIQKTVYTVGSENVKITQSIGIVKDKYEIKYSIQNNSGIEKEIGMLFHIDTMLGNDDRAPFIVDGESINEEKAYSGDDIPETFIVYNQSSGSGSNAYIQACGVLKGEGIIEAPSKFGIGKYNSVNNWNWEPSGIVGDSAYSLWWEPRTIENGSSFQVNTFYGLDVPPTIKLPNEVVKDIGPGDILLQVGANSRNQYRIELPDMRLSELNIENLSVLNRELSNDSIGKIDLALSKTISYRSSFGAHQNALEYINKNVCSYNENLTVSESRIRDVDLAKEMMKLTKNNILQQASQSIMAQANQSSNGVLQLLK